MDGWIDRQTDRRAVEGSIRFEPEFQLELECSLFRVLLSLFRYLNYISQEFESSTPVAATSFVNVLVVGWLSRGCTVRACSWLDIGSQQDRFAFDDRISTKLSNIGDTSNGRQCFT